MIISEKDCPIGWKIQRVSDVLSVNEETLGSNTPSNYAFNYLSIECVGQEEIDFSKALETTFAEAPGRARRILRDGALLFSTVRPNLKSFAIFNQPKQGNWVGSTGLAVAYPKGNHNGEFFFYQLLSAIGARQFHSLVVGTNYPAINESEFRNLKVYVPEPEEQTAIAAILSKVDAAIAATESSIRAAEKLKQALMQNLLTGKLRPDGSWRSEEEFFVDEKFGRVPLGWEVKKLKDLSVLVQYGINASSSEGGKYPMFRMNNIIQGRMVAHPMAYIDISPTEFKKYQLQKGDILFNRTNSLELVGKVGIFSLEGDYVFASYLILVRSNEENEPEYINYFLNSYPTQCNMRSKATPAVSQANINAKSLRNTLVLKPPLEEQKAIAQKIAQVDSIAQSKQAKILTLQRLKKSLMQNLLTGKVRVAAGAVATLLAEPV